LLTVDVEEDESTVKRFVEKQKYSFPILLDTEGTVSAHYGVRAHPVAYFIDAGGNFIGVVQGYRDWDKQEVRLFISSLMQELESKS